MKITLPDDTIIKLDKTLSYEDRKIIVDDLVAKWNEHITRYKKKSAKSIYFLTCLSNYLCYEKKIKDDIDQESAEQEGEKDGKEEI